MYQIHDIINIHEAKTHFSELVNAANLGREILIAKAGKPVAKLVPLNPEKPKVRFGVLKDKIKVFENFDDSLPNDLLNLFEGSS